MTTTPSDPTIGIIGRVSPTKGQRVFLEAASLIAGRRPDARFVVVGGALFGEDDYESELHRFADELGISNRVEFTGWVSDPAARLRQLTLLVHASPVPEPFGQVVVEAMAAGIPIVASAAGGVLDILDPNSGPLEVRWRMTATGVLVRPKDPAALADAVLAVLDDEVASAERTARAWEDARRRFTIQRTTKVVCAAWQGCIR